MDKLRPIYQKSHDRTLYSCINFECKVMTFVGQAFCPLCEAQAVEVRAPLAIRRVEPVEPPK